MASATATEVRPGEYRTDGKRLVRVGDVFKSQTWIEDAQSFRWEEIPTEKLATWKVVRAADAAK